ncbi:unnamed protein product [Caenorhabditis brenneri]
MAQLFPNITALVLNSTNLTNQNLNDVCQSYPNLTQLRVVYNAFNDLTGISVLRNLVYLNMAGCHIQNGYKMRGIFTLNSLRVLNISSARVQPLSRNLTNYLSCGQALPLLEFIDVSCNAITRGQLKKLVQTHPTLSTVVLIGTPLQARAQFEDHDVELITVQNLEFCIKAMRCYPKAMTANKTRVMNEMMNFLVQSYKRQKKSVLKKCLQELLNIERYDYSSAQRQPIGLSIRTRGMWHTCFQVMQTVFNQNSEAIQSICADSVFIKKFLMRTMTLIHKMHVVSIEACKFANILILNSANNIDQGLLTVYLCHLLKSSIQVQENELHQTDILNYMQNLINSNRLIHWVYYRDSSLFSLLTNLVKRRGFRAQKLAIMFFCWLKHYYECREQNLVPENLSQMEAKATPIVNTIYWYQQTGDDKLDIYNYLVCHGRGEVREWAKWILNRVPRDVPAVEVQPTWEYSQWEETKNWFAI